MHATLYIPHGGGPCIFMDDPKGVRTGMQRFLESAPAQLPETPEALQQAAGLHARVDYSERVLISGFRFN